MNAAQRSMLVWLLAALTAAYAIVTVVIFYTTGDFSAAWFVASLLVYGSLFALTLLLAFVNRLGERSSATDGPAAEDASRVTETVIYETRAGQVVRVDWEQGTRSGRDYVVAAGGTKWPLPDVETLLSRSPAAAAATGTLDQDVDRALGLASRDASVQAQVTK
jgi:hypothetical protein